MNQLSTIARVSEDGTLVSLGKVLQRCPATGRFGFQAHLQVELRTEEDERLALGILRGDIVGSLRGSVRSWLAQVGCDALHPDSRTTMISVTGRRVDAQTTLSVHGEKQRHVIAALRRAATTGQAKIWRLCMLPADAEIDPDCPLTLNLRTDGHYAFPNITEQAMCVMLHGTASGRELLKYYERAQGHMPNALGRGAFLVGAVDLPPCEAHVILEQNMYRNSQPTGIIHSGSVFLDSERSGGLQQVEIHNINGAPAPLDGLQLVARRFSASEKRP